VFDDVSREARNHDRFDASGEMRTIASILFAHLIAFDTTPFYLDEKRWKVVGYRLAETLSRCSQESRRASVALVKEFAEGMLVFCQNHAPGGPLVMFDEARAAQIEDRAEKLFTLAAHPNTGGHERSAAEAGIGRLVTSGDLGLVAQLRLAYLKQRLKQIHQVVEFIRSQHPWVFKA
jgi:hypothetical protein